MAVGDNIRRYRKAAKLTQEELADKLDVARSTIAQWERGWTKPNLGRVRDLAVALGTSMSSIAGVDDLGIDPSEVAASLDESCVPLVPFDDPTADDAERTVELPRGILRAHPFAKAMLVADDCLDRVIPQGMVAVFDPALKPKNDQVAVVWTPELGTILRRWFRAGNTLILVADSHQPHDDIVLVGNAAHTLVGTVVWAQSLDELA